MSLDVRDFSMVGQFAKSANTAIPPIPISGQAYRNANVTQQEMENGQAYDAIGRSDLWNALLFMATGIAMHAEKFGFVPFSPLTNYVGEASWCLGQDGVPYRAKQDSGPGTAQSPGIGPKPPPDSDYWETIAEYIGRSSGGGSSDLVYPGAFHSFYRPQPPRGWMVRNGGLISSADTTVPELWNALQQIDNAWMLKSETEWQTMSAATPWNGIGGVPYFVLDASARTIRLPDTRGMYEEGVGFDGLELGGVHGDAVRRVTGMIDFPNTGVGNFSGCFYNGRSDDFNGGGGGAGWYPSSFSFDNSRVVPTASVNRPKAFGTLHCVYVGKV